MSIVEQRQIIEAKLHGIFPDVDLFAYMGVGDYNFELPPKAYILEEQIKKVEELGFKISQIHYVYQESGMSDHLHVWLHKVQEWEKPTSTKPVKNMTVLELATTIMQSAEENNGKNLEFSAKTSYEKILTAAMESIGWSTVNMESEEAKLFLLRRYVNERLKNIKVSKN